MNKPGNESSCFLNPCNPLIHVIPIKDVSSSVSVSSSVFLLLNPCNPLIHVIPIKDVSSSVSVSSSVFVAL